MTMTMRRSLKMNKKKTNEKVKTKKEEVHIAVQAIMFHKNRFLLLHRNTSWTGWEFSKGAIEKGETEEEAVRREMIEETGIMDFTILEKLPYSYEVLSSNGFKVIMNLFLVKVNKFDIGDIKLDYNEHDNFKWVTGTDAVTMVRENEKKVLIKLLMEKSHIFR